MEQPNPGRPIGGPSTLGGLLLAFSTVASTGLGFDRDHGIRTCYIGMCLAADLELSPKDTADIYYAALAKDGGCTCGASQLAEFLGADEREALADFVQRDPDNELDMLRWLVRHAGRGSGAAGRARRTINALVHGSRFEHNTALEECEVAARVAQRLGLGEQAARALSACSERWDGKGQPHGLAGDAIPLAARVINLGAAVEISDRLSGRDTAVALVRSRAGKAFDPTIASAFLELAERKEFWEGFDGDDVRERVLALEPVGSHLYVGAPALDGFTELLADLVDLKRPATAGHARRVAALSRRLSERLDIAGSERATLQRAALLHDVGLMAVSAHALAQHADGAAYRAHALAPAQLLEDVPSLQAACELAALHHERIDGSGWPSGLAAARQPLGGRILAAACAFDERSGDGLAPSEALQALAEQRGLDRQVLDALADDLGAPRVATVIERPAGLTEREVEVLRLAAAGLSVREIGQRLTISHHTARHHLESTYSKIGCSSRGAAALFAAEHGLLN